MCADLESIEGVETDEQPMSTRCPSTIVANKNKIKIKVLLILE